MYIDVDTKYAKNEAIFISLLINNSGHERKCEFLAKIITL